MSFKRRSFLKALLGVPVSSTYISFISNLSETSDWTEIRDQFPLQSHRIYLNNGTFGPSPYPVLQAIQESLLHTNTTGEYGHTDLSRKVLAEFVGVKPQEISLTHNTTEGINIISNGLKLKQGDEVIITMHEHVGNALPWIYKSQLEGIKLIPFEPKATAEENLATIKKLVSSRTKVIAIPHVTCTTGLVFPIKEVCQFANYRNIFTTIDGAHGPGVFDLNLKEIGCDSYASSCHKWMLGPNGTGFLYLKEEHLDRVIPTYVGAYSDTGWSMGSNPPTIEGFNPTAHRYDYGSQSTPLYLGAAEAANFHSQIGKQRIEQRIRKLNDHLYEGLETFKSRINILSPKEKASRACMVTFVLKTKSYKLVAQELRKAGFRVRQVPESNLNAIRISTHFYNSYEEIDQLFLTLESVL